MWLLGICCRVLQPWQVFPSGPKSWAAESSAKHQLRASENIQLPISGDTCTPCWRGLRRSVLLWYGEQRSNFIRDTRFNYMHIGLIFWLLCLPLFFVCRTGTEAWSRLWLLTRRQLISFTLTLAMKRTSLLTGSDPWLLTSSHFVHAWVHIYTTQISFLHPSTLTVCSWLDHTSTYSYYFQAMECRIAGVVPVAGNWSGECCMAVKQMLAGKTVAVRLVETLENGRIHAVDILLSMGRLYI